MLKRKAVSALFQVTHIIGLLCEEGCVTYCTCIARNTYLYNPTVYLYKTDRARIA